MKDQSSSFVAKTLSYCIKQIDDDFFDNGFCDDDWERYFQSQIEYRSGEYLECGLCGRNIYLLCIHGIFPNYYSAI